MSSIFEDKDWVENFQRNLNELNAEEFSILQAIVEQTSHKRQQELLNESAIKLIKAYNTLMNLAPHTAYMSVTGEDVFKSIGRKMNIEYFRF